VVPGRAALATQRRFFKGLDANNMVVTLQFNKNELIAMTAVKRKQGRHDMQIRFGQLKVKK
jgi:hypothetical protein